MAAWHHVTLSNEQRETLVKLTDTVVVRTNEFGSDVRIEITNWKNKRLYVNFSINGKRDESQWISLEDSSDLNMQFNGDSNWLLLEALLHAEIARNTPAPVVEADAEIEFTEADDALAAETDAFWQARAKTQIQAEAAGFIAEILNISKRCWNYDFKAKIEAALDYDIAITVENYAYPKLMDLQMELMDDYDHRGAPVIRAEIKTLKAQALLFGVKL